MKLQQPRDTARGWSRSPAEFKANIGLTLFCSELCHLYGQALGPGHTGCSDIAGIMEQLQIPLSEGLLCLLNLSIDSTNSSFFMLHENSLVSLKEESRKHIRTPGEEDSSVGKTL